MPTTSNFGWTTPADTDLVKDGAAAIRTLGDGIDTSLVDLKGGSTDQVLAKNSNTDMDFKWVTSDDANAIQNAIVDAKGDLISASAADTPARLAVGTNEHRLVAASGETTGLKYVADTTNYAIAAKGDLLVGTAADTLAALTVGTDGYTLVADSTESTGVKWASPAVGADESYTLLNSGGTSLSGNSVVVSGISGINKIMVLMFGVDLSTSGGFYLRINSDSGSNYRYMSFKPEAIAGTDAKGVGYEGGNLGSVAASHYIAGATNVAQLSLRIDGGNSTGYKAFTFIGSGVLADTPQWGQGIWQGSATISSIQAVCEGVKTFTGGTIYVYGSQK